jgi:hypothetical protein
MSRRCRALNGIAFWGLSIYLVLAFVSFFTFVEPSLNGPNGWRVYADSDVYMEVANYIRNQGGIASAVALLSLARNLILPAIVVLTLGTAAHIAIFNVAVFLAALGILAQTFPRFKWHVFLPIILVSPTTYQALLTTNKEIFVFLSAVFIARWFQTRSMTLMYLLILLSAALRWEQALVVLFFLIFIRKKISPRFAAFVLTVA